MTDQFNPHAPCILGLEWRPTIEFEGLVHGRDTNVVGFWLTSTVAETVDRLHLLATAAQGDTRGFVVEVYDVAALANHTTTTAEFLPTLTTVTSNMTGYGAYSDLTDLLQDDPATWVPGLYLFPSGFQELLPDTTFVHTSTGGPGYLGMKFGSVVGAIPSTAMVQSVDFQCWGQTAKGNTPAQAASLIVPVAWRDGVPYAAGNQLYMGPDIVEGTGRWVVDPATGQPWLLADVENFDATVVDSNYLAALMPTYGGPEVFTLMGSTRLVVTYTDPDPRVAYGYFDQRSISPGWRGLTLTQPDGTPGWPKANGTEYLVILRRYPENGRQVNVRALGYRAPGDHAYAPQPLTGCTLTFDDAHFPNAAEQVRTNAMAAVLEVSGAASADSQPYGSADGDTEWTPWGNDPNSFYSEISRFDTGQQDMAATAGGDYQYVRFLARAHRNYLPSAPLTVTVRLRSDDSIILGPVDWVPFFSLTAPYDVWQLQEYTFPAPATVAPGTAIYVQFESDAPAGDHWHVQCLSTLSELPAGRTPPTGTDATTYGGTTDTLRWRSVGVQRDQADYCVILAELPPPVADLAAVVGGTGCAEDVTLTWTQPSALDCSLPFGGYELQREDGPGTWHTVAIIWDAATVTWTDLEAPRNSTVNYRIRQRALDGPVSVWSDEATCITADDCCGYRFSSNTSGDTLWFEDINPPRTYNFTDHTAYVEFEAEDYAAGFQELQQRPDVLPITLMLAADGANDATPAASPPGRTVFDEALRLFGEQRQADGTLLVLPYLAVADETGYVWFASVKASTGTRLEPGGLYTLDVKVTQVTGSPIPVEVGTAP